ncbi:aldo/keto reductase [Cohnella fermenti]|uniref:Aldo/keto reductase n=1 Tax=Cohnella fermenti TaxID=2565925 RepID=A0A4S4BQU4_9BACL|nr:aldo/keto reductase [Cohnella fermenti]THF77313.1 aldo/keto reductase [Cohnella fermenti]
MIKMSGRYEGGVPLSRLTLGTAQLGLKGYGIANAAEEVDADRMLAACEQAGIRSFDTAPEYGSSEQRLGDCFSRRVAPTERTVMTKVKLPADPAMSEREIEAYMYDSVRASLERLRLPRLSVLQLHDPDVLGRCGSAVTRTMRRLRAEGLIAAGGVSLTGHTAEQYLALADQIRDDVYTVVQVPFNVFDHRLLRVGAIERMREEGKAIVARSVFLQGLFALEPASLPGGLRQAEPSLRSLRRLAEEEGVSTLQLAFSFVRDYPGIDSLIVGMERPEQLDANIRLLSGPPLSERALAAIGKLFGEVPEELLIPGQWRKG